MMAWFFFGCGRQSGHNLICAAGQDEMRVPYSVREALRNFDGSLVPRLNTPLGYQACVSRFHGLGFSALSWRDYTVDTRPGSNAIVWCPSVDASPETIYRGFARFFPQVEGRFRRFEKQVGASSCEESRVGISDREVVDSVPRMEVGDRRVWIPSVNYGRYHFRDEANELQERKSLSTVGRDDG